MSAANDTRVIPGSGSRSSAASLAGCDGATIPTKPSAAIQGHLRNGTVSEWEDLTIVEWWAAIRSGDPEALAVLDATRRTTVDDEARLARLVRAEARADHLDRVCIAALGALTKGNHGAAVHVLTHRHDWTPE